LKGKLPLQWQGLDEHLKAVGTVAAGFAAEFRSAEWAEVAGWFHDLGKAHPAFQAYLLRENGLNASEYDGESGNGRINHSGTGAIIAMEKWNGQVQFIGKVFAYLIAGHHAGLPDWVGGRDALDARLRNEGFANKNFLEKCRQFLPNSIGSLRPPAFATSCRDGLAPSLHFWIRMLFSCLVDADFLDTEAFMDSARSSARSCFLSLPQLKTRFDFELEEMMGRARQATPEKEINHIRASILAECRKAAFAQPGFFQLSVPTGGGKTLSGTAFALDHCVAHGKRRIIYVIPFTSIIEQTATVLRRFLGGGNVVEHHSNVSPDTIEETPGLTLAAENWDAPVIVTTNVQFFESLFAAKPGRCRKLHNIANSVVLLDEAQLLPTQWLVPCVEAMNQLVTNYGTTIVFSTATQPVLPRLAHEPRPIIGDVTGLYRKLKRTEIRFPEDMNRPMTWPELAELLSEHQQVLCIVNRRSDCFNLWKLMPPKTIHLSALMCGKHRSRVIQKIKQRLNEGKTTRVVSTQLVEAGVDFDFPVVYRAMAGLDSINQAAGRCNREGTSPNPGKVQVFVPPQPSPKGLLRKGEDVTRDLALSRGFLPEDPATYSEYFRRFYGTVNDMGEEWLKKNLVNDANPAVFMQFRTAAREFRLIDDHSVSVVVSYGHNHRLLRDLRIIGPTREILRRLQHYTVSVPEEFARGLLAEGRIEKIHDSILVQADSMLYDETVGLNLFQETFRPEEHCI
jgi:CRISPR-associated endonuclease/helicase Cas3